MNEPIAVRSHKHTYEVTFSTEPFRPFGGDGIDRHVIVDRRVRQLYAKELDCLESAKSVIEVDAKEETKSLENLPAVVAQLVEAGVRRNDRLVAIGGGIIQDITAYLGSTLLRGVDWEFYPTTLLAQADSCIGSKSSINACGKKNLLGTFLPPVRIFLCTAVLRTLDPQDMRSGVGEIIKAHAIAGPDRLAEVTRVYDTLFSDSAALERFIRSSLEIKKPYAEIDEFDRRERNIFNYGHSFGHAIEAATHFAVPHGIGVTMGMDVANYVATQTGRIPVDHFRQMHELLTRNAQGFMDVDVPMDAFIDAIASDKKNAGSTLTLILLNGELRPEKAVLANDARFRTLCEDYFRQARYSCYPPSRGI